MRLRDLIHSGDRTVTPAPREEASDNPLLGLQRDINRVFDEFWGGFGRSVGRAFPSPALHADMTETEQAVEISIELPGVEEKEIDLTVSDETLMVRGEKKAEREEERKGVRFSERSYGAFSRAIPLPSGVDAEKAEARFRNGVLTVTLPKTAEARERTRRIEIRPA